GAEKSGGGVAVFRRPQRRGNRGSVEDFPGNRDARLEIRKDVAAAGAVTPQVTERTFRLKAGATSTRTRMPPRPRSGSFRLTRKAKRLFQPEVATLVSARRAADRSGRCRRCRATGRTRSACRRASH